MTVAEMLMKVLCVAVVCMVVAAPYTEATEGKCGPVVDKMNPCKPFLINGGSVPANCCNSLRGINNDSKSVADKSRACICIIVFLMNFEHKHENALGLPDKCGVKFPYKISNITDCPK